ncbi:MAG: bifunctional (p)ppGpp synthetase/guanosine-3',5'-bis(diphosphate) 3'-pyrophosphohydrolase [Pseudomonadota bacterium]
MSQLKTLIKTAKSYMPDLDPAGITKAHDFAKEKHKGQTRVSGEPYYTHPMEVAQILADMRLDEPTILTAILHDTLEDTPATFDELEQEFSLEVADLVNGVSKLTKIESQSFEGKQAENFRKLLVAMSEDIRVLLVKLSDRLHNMRTLHHFKDRPDKCQRISKETTDIYAPLAERIGMHQIKEELDDLSFSYLYPDAQASITKRLSFLREEGTKLIKKIIKTLDQEMKKAGIKAEITGREKTRYSIWKKMQRKNISFEQLSDIMAFRIVVENVEECYHTLGILHSHYPTVPGRFKDYISTPKPNGYRSLHTTVLGPEKQRIEIQIRTKEMHEEADLGVAAHWAYKDGKKSADHKDVNSYRWLRELLEILEQSQRPEDFLENTKLELFQDRVFVFSPRGDLIELPNGATPVDFAYAIHSDVGDKTVGAKVNGRIAPLNTKLNNGDQVEIITSKTQNPSPAWERFVVTGKARSHIKRYVRQQQKTEYAALGQAMLKKIFQQEEYNFSDKAVAGVVKQLRVDDVEDIYANIGSGHFKAIEVFKKIFPAHKAEMAKAPKNKESQDYALAKREGSDKPLPIKGLIPGMAVHFARCCHPLPGDRIVGIVSTGKGVTIHTIDCETLETFADTPERWIDVSWGDGEDSPESHVGRLNVTFLNQPGGLGTVSTVIGKNGGNIVNLKITNRSVDFWDIIIDVYVNDTKHLNNVIAALRATPEITSVDRAKGR